MNIVVLSIATNGYADVYAKLLASHRDYCARNGYRYLLIDRTPPFGLNGADICWLRAPLIGDLLRRGYHVFFLDADAMIMPEAPKAQTVFEAHPDCDIFLAPDFRDPAPNAGVIFAAPTPRAVRFFSRLTALADVHHRLLPFHKPVHNSPHEQGHMRWMLQWHRGFCLLDRRWNLMEAEAGDSYVWHGDGPAPGRKPATRIHLRTKWQLLTNVFVRGPRSIRLRRAMRFYRSNHLLDAVMCVQKAAGG